MAKKTYRFKVVVHATVEVDAFCEAEAKCLADNIKFSDLTDIQMETSEIELDIAAE